MLIYSTLPSTMLPEDLPKPRETDGSSSRQASTTLETAPAVGGVGATRPEPVMGDNDTDDDDAALHQHPDHSSIPSNRQEIGSARASGASVPLDDDHVRKASLPRNSSEPPSGGGAACDYPTVEPGRREACRTRASPPQDEGTRDSGIPAVAGASCSGTVTDAAAASDLQEVPGKARVASWGQGNTSSQVPPPPPALERGSNFTGPGAYRVLGPLYLFPVNDSGDDGDGPRDDDNPEEADVEIGGIATRRAADGRESLEWASEASAQNSSETTLYLVEASLVDHHEAAGRRDSAGRPGMFRAECSLGPAPAAPLAAEEVEVWALQEPRRPDHPRRWLCTALVLAAVIGLSVGAALGATHALDPQRGDTQNIALVAPPPTPAPTPAPTWSPAAQQWLSEFRSRLPADTRTALERDDDSPPAQAHRWLAATPWPVLSNYTNSRAMQRFALAAVYYATHGVAWLRNDYWLTLEHECSWYTDQRGLSPCDQDGETFRVLALHDNRLNGTLPAELGLLTDLHTLDLVTHPLLSGPLPDTLAQVTNLRNLILSDNALTGPFPANIANHSELQYLDLSHGRFTGPLPSDWSHLTKLESLRLLDNVLTGPLPSSFQHLTALRNFDVGENLLEGTIPSALGRFTFLQHLALCGNRLTGPIPTTLGSLSRLSYLHLAHNPSLTGTIPSELGDITALQILRLQDTDLNGTVPSALCSHVGGGDPTASPALSSKSSTSTSSSRVGAKLSLTVDCDSVQCACDCECGEKDPTTIDADDDVDATETGEYTNDDDRV